VDGSAAVLMASGKPVGDAWAPAGRVIDARNLLCHVSNDRRRRVANIFVSFTKSDQQWAHWIAQELTELHHEPHVHDWEIGPGEDVVGWMERRHDQGDYARGACQDPWRRQRRRPATAHQADKCATHSIPPPPIGRGRNDTRSQRPSVGLTVGPSKDLFTTLLI
jgi:hypothetical protein